MKLKRTDMFAASTVTKQNLLLVNVHIKKHEKTVNKKVRKGGL